MPNYLITGTIQFCIRSRWSEITISETTRADTADAARKAVLARHEGIACEQDAYATVRWYSQASVVVAAQGWCV